MKLAVIGPPCPTGTRLWSAAGNEGLRRSVGCGVGSVRRACRQGLNSRRGGSRPRGPSVGAHAARDRAEVRAPPAHQMSSQPIRFLPLGPDSAVAALEEFPLVATPSQPMKRRIDSSCAPSGPGGRRFKSCLPDQHVSCRIHFRLVWGGSGFCFACARAGSEVLGPNFKALRTSQARPARSQEVVGACLRLNRRNLQMLSSARYLPIRGPAPPAHHLRAKSG